MKFKICKYNRKKCKWEVLKTFSDRIQAVNWMNAQSFQGLMMLPAEVADYAAKGFIRRGARGK